MPARGDTTGELIERVRKAVDAEPLDRASAVAVAERLEEEAARGSGRSELLEPLLEAAQELGRRGHGDEVTYSKNVFIPLTNLCRDRCAYCTFAVQPDSPRAKTYRLDEVRETSRRARQAGCREALFCLGDKPELAYRSYRGWLDQQGYASTSEYLVEACQVAFEEGLFPHSNAGIMDEDELRALRPWNASMGLMLETTSQRLRERGEAHYYCPDKDPRLRIGMTRDAGRLRIPFTTGILIGIGETPEERVDTLWTIRELAGEGGHIQEVIVQNFHPKPGTSMSGRPAPSDEIMAGTVALARLVLGAEMNLQAPPNLSPTSLELLVRSGLNDWGGVSPVTIDFINPEAPWPELEELQRRTEAAGYRLRERHGAYPADIAGRPELFDPRMLAALRADSDAQGYPVGTSS
ncbi:MAG: 7,8-didemethyl-8-hydroxy-5-deazariboflavin synthase CofG [Deltaproteobacteria bacterium]|nr:7,8-didemethyl-8-hydroxy-5-deazariboflavin synthase CofG [Deltaproteobacteria bacterium]